jgi:DNA-binding NarL/FixJ family response regulator
MIPYERVTLTRRELNLLPLVADGLADKEIAWRLRLTTGTVKEYLHRLRHKLGANNRVQLAVWWLKRPEIQGP